MVRNTYEVQNIGDLLREKRKQLGKDIKDIAETTKIRTEYLVALETGNYDKFAANVYAKGFLKKYAKHLGINPDRAVAMYRREQKSRTAVELGPAGYFAARLNTVSLDINPTRLMALIIALIIAGFALYIVAQISAVARPPKLEVISPVTLASGAREVIQVTQNPMTLVGLVDPGSSLELNGQRINTNNFERFTVNGLELNEGENNFVLLATNQFNQTSRIDLVVVFSVTNQSVTNAETGAPAEEIRASFTIEGRDAYVQLRTDGRPTARIYRIGETEEVSANETFTLSTTSPDAINLNINDIPYQITEAREYVFRIENGAVVFEG